MKTRFGWALVSAMILGGIGSAFAADMPLKAKAPPPMVVDSWTGFYIGINGGGIWGRDHLTAAPLDAATTAFWGACFAAGACPRDYGRTDGSSGEFGGQVGYNWQVRNFVFGVEGDIQWSGLNNSRSVATAIFAPFAGATNTRLDWFGTGRGRVGFLATPAWLLYATGGIAFGNVRHTWSAGFPTLAQTWAGTNEDTRVGWVVGVGSEWKFARNWIVGLEYLHMELDSTSFNTAPTGAGCTTTGLTSCNFVVNADRFRADIVRARVSYQFGGPVVAKY
jgi:outer membrane immunogenic protein